MLQSRVIAALRSHAFRRSYSSIGVFPDLVKDKTVQLTNSRGVNVIHDPLLSKGTAFSIAERERLSLRGLVPPRCQEMDKQLARVKANLDACETPLSKFVFVTALQDRNETLFYRLLIDNLEELAGIIYTPTVGLACQRFHSIYRRSRGMYFSTQDRGAMSAMVYNWPQEEVDVIVVTDGSRVLGLGDLGANGMQIPIGKLSLYVAAGGIRPKAILPVVLDVGTNNEQLLHDPLYLGMGHPRLDNEDYYSFVDEWVQAVKARWPNALIQFEDFKYPHAYNLLNKYRDEVTCFNDDIQSTSAITLAGILAALKARGLQQEQLAEERIVCVGAGSAGVGVCEGIIDCMVAQGRVRTREEAYSKIWMLDQHGLLGNAAISSNDPGRIAQGPDRPVKLDERQRNYAKMDLPDRISLEEVVERVKNGQVCRTNQCNNSYSFPGLGLGITVSRATKVTPSMFLETAKTIANLASPSQLKEGTLFPGVAQLRQVALAVGTRVCEVAFEEGVASSKLKEGEILQEVVKASMYEPEYVPLVYSP
ncbi:hypothetical protein K450DRAFT_240274 [Umbelopsis ramanniana AG]|uniref:Malic enzyme n=1 Tax=Umbelopsis ramanniana AG TaxID=1314678 RepID=A0AAD5EAA0_UMBRA|nr:uncharacterized protein K450DRAFT_240274 [Umbelopsis ramanniana AG]KAI8579774.1 hypothetical protein K450DRAFT_240274 [Umbelopsis ramanniana AG]